MDPLSSIEINNTGQQITYSLGNGVDGEQSLASVQPGNVQLNADGQTRQDETTTKPFIG